MLLKHSVHYITLLKYNVTACVYTNHFGSDPTISNARRAILLCRFHFSTAMAIISPPRPNMEDS